MFYDVVTVRAGPCGLAATTRVHEKPLSALFTNDEHARYWAKHRQNSNTLEKEQGKRKSSTVDSGYGSEDDGDVAHVEAENPSMIVVDASASDWMSTWNQRFRDLKISHPRSPLFFHPKPRNRDGLQAFAHEQGRTSELQQIKNVVGKDLGKHEKKRQNSRKPSRKVAEHLGVNGWDKIDYFNPSIELFEDYCDSIIHRYSLQGWCSIEGHGHYLRCSTAKSQTWSIRTDSLNSSRH